MESCETPVDGGRAVPGSQTCASEQQMTTAALELHWASFDSISGRSRERSCGEAFHCLTQLRIDFVCDGHDSHHNRLKSILAKLSCSVENMQICNIRDSSTSIAAL